MKRIRIHPETVRQRFIILWRALKCVFTGSILVEYEVRGAEEQKSEVTTTRRRLAPEEKAALQQAAKDMGVVFEDMGKVFKNMDKVFHKPEAFSKRQPNE